MASPFQQQANPSAEWLSPQGLDRIKIPYSLLRGRVYCFDKGHPHPEPDTQTFRRILFPKTKQFMRSMRLMKLASAKSLESILLVISLSATAILVGCGNSSSGGSGSSGPPAQIAQTGGSGQSATVGTPFSTPFAATVEDSKNNPVSGATVTFTAPASGPSGTFPNGTATESDTTNSSGVATSHAFMANSTDGGPYNVTAAVSGVTTTVSYSLVNNPSATLTVTAGAGQGAVINTAFSKFAVQVALNGLVDGVSVTFTAPTSGASGKFANGTNTEMDTTVNGVATSSVFTANGTTGEYLVQVSSPAATNPITIQLVNTSAASSPLGAGNYVFSLAGTDATSGFYTLAGVFTVDSSGLITHGEQTFSDAGNVQPNEPINYGALAPTSDGNVLIILNTNVGPGGNGTETFHAAPVSSSQFRLIEFDTGATASGDLDLQTSTSALCPAFPCGYAFYSAGVNSNGNSLQLGGVITIDGANGAISGGTDSVFDASNNHSGTQYIDQSFSASSVSSPDAFGLVQFNMNTSSALTPNFILSGYIVDANHIRLIENRQDDKLKGITLGTALAQTGTFSTSSISGSSYVLALEGTDNQGALQLAGLVTANSDLSVSGSFNYNDLTGVGIQNPNTITGGTYTVDTTGRVTMSNVTDGSVAFQLEMYLTGDGNATALTLDSTDTIAGLGYQQTGGGSFTAASFSGKYALAATGVAKPSSTGNEDELDAVGGVTADGVGSLTGTGSVDLNWIFNTGPTTGLNLSGAFTARPSGVFTGTITGLNAAALTTQDSFTYYVVDTTKVVAIETDKNQLTLGLFEEQQ